MLVVTRHALEDTFEEVPLNEAHARVILNPILLCLIFEEKTRANRQASLLAEQNVLLTTNPPTARTVPVPNRTNTEKGAFIAI